MCRHACYKCKDSNASFVVLVGDHWYCIPCYESMKPREKNNQTKLFK